MSIAERASNKRSDIDRIYEEKGSWEEWAQVELAFDLSAEYNASKVRRHNGACITSDLCADVVMRREPMYDPIIIHLKCKSHLQDRDGAQFAARLDREAQQIRIAEFKESLVGGAIWIMGICCEPLDEGQARRMKRAGFNMVRVPTEDFLPLLSDHPEEILAEEYSDINIWWQSI